MFGRKNRPGSRNAFPPFAYTNQYQMGFSQGGNSYIPNLNPYHLHPNGMNYGVQLQPGMPYPYGEGYQIPGGYSFLQNSNMNNQTYPAEWILQNPLQPKKNSSIGGGNAFPYMHPYPKPGMSNRPPAGVNSIMNSFKKQDGNLDFNKMIDTAGQMMNAVNQVSGLVKGLGGIFKVL